MKPSRRRVGPRDLLVVVVPVAAPSALGSSQQERYGDERGGVGEQRHLCSGGCDEEAGQGRARRGAGRESHVEDAVAFAQEAGRLEDRARRGARARSRGRRERSVDGRDGEHSG